MDRKGRTESESMRRHHRLEFYEHHRVLAILVILAAFFGPIVGVFVSGVTGLMLGVAIPTALYYLVPYAANKNHGSGGDHRVR